MRCASLGKSTPTLANTKEVLSEAPEANIGFCATATRARMKPPSMRVIDAAGLFTSNVSMLFRLLSLFRLWFAQIVKDHPDKASSCNKPQAVDQNTHKDAGDFFVVILCLRSHDPPCLPL